METIGKILSITLLTIFGSAAATVYVVDSSYFKSFLGTSTVTYTSDEVIYSGAQDFSDSREYREKQEKKYVAVEKNSDSASYNPEKNTIWGQKYSAGPNDMEYENRRASSLARNNSLESLRENMEYWSAQYKRAAEAGESRSANLAYKNYEDYREALEIRQSKGD
ncbi:MAG: hypothetical protein RIG61_02850 [Deltaproteobacteria bacterium]